MKSPIIGAVLVIASMSTAAAQAPVAIVEEVKGKVTGAEFMDYVAPGAVIKLGADGVVVISYLASCLRETIKGGVAIVGAEESRISLGDVSREKVGCDARRAQLSDRQATQSAATTFRSISAATPDGTAAQSTVYGLSPILELAQPGKVVIERLDAPGERFEVVITPKMLVKGKFYDLGTAGKALKPGGSYAAIAGSRKSLFRVDPLARPGASPVVGRLVRL
jgi:hypothetical protein